MFCQGRLHFSVGNEESGDCRTLHHKSSLPSRQQSCAVVPLDHREVKKGRGHRLASLRPHLTHESQQN